MTSIDQLNRVYPYPHSVDKDDLLDVVENLAIEDTPREDQEVFADWYRSVPVEIREEAALDRPAEILLAEYYSYPMYEAYRTAIRRDPEVKHLKRMIWAQDKEIKRLQSAIKSAEFRLDNLRNYMSLEVMAACNLQHSCAECPVGRAAHERALDCRQFVERDIKQAEYVASEWRMRHNE